MCFIGPRSSETRHSDTQENAPAGRSRTAGTRKFTSLSQRQTFSFNAFCIMVFTVFCSWESSLNNLQHLMEEQLRNPSPSLEERIESAKRRAQQVRVKIPQDLVRRFHLTRTSAHIYLFVILINWADQIQRSSVVFMVCFGSVRWCAMLQFNRFHSLPLQEGMRSESVTGYVMAGEGLYL